MNYSSNGNLVEVRQTLRPDEVSLIFGISTAQLQKYRQTGEGPPYTKPSHRCVLYRRTDIEAWLDGFGRTSTSQVR